MLLINRRAPPEAPADEVDVEEADKEAAEEEDNRDDDDPPVALKRLETESSRCSATFSAASCSTVWLVCTS
jgi:hypothetical protein